MESTAESLVYLLVESVALAGILVLAKRTPDMIQLFVLAVGFFGMVVFIFANIAGLLGYHPIWPIRLIAYRIEHAAFLLYILRQVWIKSNICQSLKS